MTDAIGRSVAWLTAVMVLVTLAVVVLRYAFDSGSIMLQESVIYLHACVFMLGIPYTLRHNGHVRVDIFRARQSARGRAWVDLLGHLLFLLPVSATILIYSTPYALAAWRVFEGSAEVGGIPALFLLKSLIPVSAGLLFAQGLAEAMGTVTELRRNARNATPLD